jgi:uncharacterized protein
MSQVVSEEDLVILVKAGLNEAAIRHSILVATKATEIAERTGMQLDMQLTARGALYHDVGKAMTHSFQRGELGAEIGKRHGLPKASTAIARKRFHGRLSPKEARDLDLPAVEDSPTLLEERPVLYADRRLGILPERIITFKEDQEAEARRNTSVDG